MDRLTFGELSARPALLPAILFAIGVGLADATSSRSGLFLALGALCWLLAWAAAPRTGTYLLTTLGFAFLGAGLAHGHASVDVPPGQQLENGERVLEGRVERVDVLEDATRIRLAVSRVEPGGPARFRVALTGRGPTYVLAGQRIRVPARLRLVEGPSNPGEPDFTGVARARGQHWRGSFATGRLVLLSEPHPLVLWRHRTVAALDRAVRAVAPDSAAASLYLTLAAGERAALGAVLEEQFARSGLAHVLSVSGLHVAVLGFSLLTALRWGLVRVPAIARRMDVRRLAAPVAIPLVWAYVAFTGNQPPAVRSAVMTSAVLLGLMLGRRADALNALLLAALGLLVVDPSGLFDLSLQLSFLSVGSLLLVGPALRAALPLAPSGPPPEGRIRAACHRAREAVLQTVCASIAVVVATLPWVASAFGRVSVAGLVSNVVCLPLGGILTLMAAGGAALFCLLPWAATPVLWLGAWLSKLLVMTAQWMSHAPGAVVPVPAYPGWAFWLHVLGIVSWVLATGRGRWLGWSVPAALVLSLVTGPFRPRPGLEVTFLSVGQGDAVVLSSGGEHALVDGGGVPGGKVGRRHVLPFLRQRGIRQLRFTALSHPHPDHALGLTEVLEEVPTRELWLAAGTTEGILSESVISAAGPARVLELEQGHPAMHLGEARIEVLGPPEDRELLEGVNDRSLVLRVTHGEVSILLTGDIEAPAEEQMPAPGSVTVLKAPHHGSRTSSTRGWVERMRPRFVVFCVGSRNRFGFPHPEVEARYRAVGARCFRTDLDGAVTFRSDGRDVEFETFRERQSTDEERVADGEGHPQLTSQ